MAPLEVTWRRVQTDARQREHRDARPGDGTVAGVEPGSETARHKRINTKTVWVVIVVAVTTVAGAAAWVWGREAAPGAAPTVTLAPVPVPPGAPPVRQDLSKPCQDAVAPIRELMQDVPDGRLLDEDGAVRLNAGLASGAAACETTEWARFHELELRGWLSPAGPVATQPAGGATSGDAPTDEQP